MVDLKKNQQIYIIATIVLLLLGLTFGGIYYLNNTQANSKKITALNVHSTSAEDKLYAYIEDIPNKKNPNATEKALQVAQRDLENGDYLKISKNLEQVLAKEENAQKTSSGSKKSNLDIEAKTRIVATKILLAQSYLAQGNGAYTEKSAATKVLNLLQGVVKSEGDDDDYGAYGKYFVGYAYEMTRQYNKALFYYTKGRKVSSNTDKMNAVFENQIGHIYNLQGNLEKAYKSYRAAYYLNPSDPSVGLNIGRYLIRMGKTKEAIPYFEAVAKTKNAALSSEAAYNLSSIYVYLIGENKSNLDKSLAYAKVAVQRNKKYPLGYVGVARAYILQGKNADEAKTHLEKAISLYPKLAIAYEWMGMLEQTKGIYDKALDNFALSIKYLPEDITLMKDELAQSEARLDFYMAITFSLGKSNEDTMVYINKMLAIQNTVVTGMLKEELQQPDYGLFYRSKGYAPFEKMAAYFK